MLQKGWWVIVLTALAALNVTLVFDYQAVPQYRAGAKFIISPNASLGTGRDVVNGLSALDRRSIIATYAEVMNSNRIFAEAGQALQLTPAELEDYSSQAVVLPDATVIDLYVDGPNPQIAAALANGIGQQVIDYTRTLNQVFDVSFLDTASPPTQPASPQPARDAALALGLGTLGGMLLAVLREQLRLPLEALRNRSMLDSASGAYSRRHFQRTLEESVARYRDAAPVSVGLIQLRGLRDLTETLPAVVMQQLLHQVVRTLRNELRGNDSIGRWGEASFVVLLPATPSSAATRTLERIRQALLAPVEIQGQGEAIYLEPQVGVAVGHGDQPAQALMESAEAALNRVSRNGSEPAAVLAEEARPHG